MRECRMREARRRASDKRKDKRKRENQSDNLRVINRWVRGVRPRRLTIVISHARGPRGHTESRDTEAVNLSGLRDCGAAGFRNAAMLHLG
jgi:hypothetical protein